MGEHDKYIVALERRVTEYAARIGTLEQALHLSDDVANARLDEMERQAARIAELEKLLGTEKEYSAEVLQRSNRFAAELEKANARIAKLEEKTLKEERWEN